MEGKPEVQKYLNYEYFPLLINIIVLQGQSLQKAIKEDEEKITDMKGEVDSLKKRLEQSKKDKIGEVERMEV